MSGQKKNLGKKKEAPDDDRRQTKEHDRRRRVVFGNVAFDIIQGYRLRFEAEGLMGKV